MIARIDNTAKGGDIVTNAGGNTYVVQGGPIDMPDPIKGPKRIYLLQPVMFITVGDPTTTEQIWTSQTTPQPWWTQ